MFPKKLHSVSKLIENAEKRVRVHLLDVHIDYPFGIKYVLIDCHT